MIQINEKYVQVTLEENRITGLVEEGVGRLADGSVAYFAPTSLILAGGLYFVRAREIIATEHAK